MEKYSSSILDYFQNKSISEILTNPTIFLTIFLGFLVLVIVVLLCIVFKATRPYPFREVDCSIILKQACNNNNNIGKKDNQNITRKQDLPIQDLEKSKNSSGNRKDRKKKQ